MNHRGRRGRREFFTDRDIMSWYGIIALAFGLSMDAFAVATAASISLHPAKARQVFRLSFHFGLFQFLMPVLGWSVGRTLAALISQYDHWIALVLLSFIGGKMIAEAFSEHKAGTRSDPTKGLTMVMLSIATSIDALAVGLSLAFLNVSIWIPSLVIGLTTASVTTAAMCLGGRFGAALGRKAEVVGGIVLIGIGVQILISHLR